MSFLDPLRPACPLNRGNFIVGTAEGLGGKLLRPSLSCNQAFEYAIRDIEKKADIYLADVLAH